MSRRGRCRCGSVLRFQKGPNGYKTRCLSCGSVVRLRRATVRARGKKCRLTCPCGANLFVRRGMKRTTCPDCKRTLMVPKNHPPRAASLAALGGEPGRTVTCETCQRIVSARASQCPSCGSGLALTTAAPILESRHSSSAVMQKMLSYRPLIGWLAGAAAGIVIAAMVLIFSLRH
jgi:hypothetical protein